MFILSHLLPVIALAIAILVRDVQTEGYYTITSPGSIRPNSKYTVHLSVTDVPENTKIQLSLKGPMPTEAKVLDMPPDSEERVTFELGAIPKGSYTLEAEGLSGVIFQNVSALEFVENLPRVYIQTDKALYRHGETIQFRLICLDQYLLPAKINQPLSVTIKDAENNAIQRFDNIELNTGIFKGKLKLAESFVSGAWTLVVHLGSDRIADKIVEVKEYELPLFEVVLEAPEYVSFNQKSFPVAVRAHYTFGKPVTGYCTFNFITKGRPAVEEKYALQEGHAEKLIDIQQFGKKLQNIYINVTIEDTVMRISRTVSKTVSIVAKRYVIDTPSMIYECDGPNDQIIYRAHISQYNGAPVDSEEEAYIEFEVDVKEEEERPTWVTYPDNRGYVEAEVGCWNYTNYNVTITYKGQRAMGDIQLYHTTDSRKGGVYVKTQYPKVDSPIEVRLVSHEEFSSFACVIVGRGNIVYDDIITIPNGRSIRKHTFKVTATYEMMPKAHIFVYFIKNGKMIYYETTFTVEKQFQNSISIDTPETVKPGTFISVNVDTDPESYVGLLGMDKSVLLLKAGNDLDAETIFSHLEEAETKTPKAYLPQDGSYPGEIAGLVTMTNAPYDGALTQNIMNIRARAARPRQRVRRNFFETFAFDDFMSVDGHDNVMTKIPDTITSWVITGFSINPKTGFTLTTTPTVLRTFLEFFIAVNLPYAVKVGETITLPVVIFNYLHTDTKANVLMEIENGEFEFVGNVDAKADTIHTFVNREKSETVFFAIRPKVAGIITLKITAECPFASDVIVKKLKVEHEGITEWNNVDFYINGEESKAIKLDIPQESVVPGSEQIDISVMDFIMGSMLNLVNSSENFDNLIRSPTGCGEQNMIYSVANLMVLKYLESTNTSNQALYEKAKQYLEKGYQRQFTYKLPDGSFSTWGREPGITWLTAYVVRIFHEAKQYIFVDEDVLIQGLDFLATKQEADGSFREDGKLIDFATLNNLSVTASVLLAFLENSQYLEKYKDIVDKGFEYVRNNVKENDDIRAVAISLYLLQKRKDPIVEELLTMLEAKAKTNDDHKWWQYAEKPRNTDVHITGYILITMIELNKPVEPIVKWLVSKRNSNGGFASTFETEVGLRALATYAQKYREGGNNMDINVHSQGQLLQKFTVGEESKDLNNKIELPRHIRELDFVATGNGKATLQIAYSYNSLTPENVIFSVNSSISTEPTTAMKTLEVCTQLTATQVVRTSMAVMEVNLPSGEEIAPGCCDLTHMKLAKSVQRSNANQKLDIYFDGFVMDYSECVYIPTVKVHNVTEQKYGSIVMYDYYDKNALDKHYYKMD